jgi:hypothetical protein
MRENNAEEVDRRIRDRLELDKIRKFEKRGDDKIVNMLLNVIEFSYLNKKT